MELNDGGEGSALQEHPGRVHGVGRPGRENHACRSERQELASEGQH